MRLLRIFIATVFVALIPPVLACQHSLHPGDRLWSWCEKSNTDTTLDLQLVENGKVIYRYSFPICRVKESDHSKALPKTIVFSVKGGHVFQGEYRTVATETIEGNIWQAGTDADDILFGMSFTKGNSILLNTIHIAYPNRAAISIIGRGLVVKTSPLITKSR